MGDVTIFGAPQSTYVRTVRMTLEEKGVPYQLEAVNPRDAAYRETRHPFGKMPAFQHGEVRVYETSAITQYIDEAFPGASLVPADPAHRALMNQWISVVIDYYYGAMIRNYVLEYVFPSGSDGSPDQHKIQAAQAETRHQLAVAEKSLAQHEFLAGGELSLADLFLAPILFYLTTMPESEATLADAPKVRGWFKNISSRPSFAATTPPPPPKG